MNQSSQNASADLQIAFVQARWHSKIVGEAGKAFVTEMAQLTDASPEVETFDVPGAFEIPLQARMLAKTGRYAAIVACAFVVDGGIYRHEFVADAVVGALMQVQLETDVPVLSAVLTPHHFHETDEHEKFFLDHFAVKGREAAEACMAVLAMREKIIAAA